MLTGTQLAAQFSSTTDMWATPLDFFRKLDEEFGFETDVCATADNAKCSRFFSAEEDGLKQEWTGLCWMNPPYGRGIGAWVRKAWESAQTGRSTVVCLLPARTDTAWWHEYIWDDSKDTTREGVQLRLIRGRLKFGESKNSAPFPSAVVIFRAKVKTCNKCRVTKPTDEGFHQNLRQRDGRDVYCRVCVREKVSAHRKRNPEKAKEQHRNWREANLDYARASCRAWAQANREHLNGYRRQRRADAGEEYVSKMRVYHSRRKQEDVQYRLTVALRGRTSDAVKHGRKAGSAIRDLGADIGRVREHIESLFTEGMSWGNWGRTEGSWQLDHIMPLSAFDLTNRQHFVLACHYLNLRPLWRKENNSKSGKIPEGLF